MAIGMVPDEGELQLEAVVLPPGRRIVARDGPQEPVAWVTTQLVPDAGLVWSALSDAHRKTGLVPVLLADDEDEHDYFFLHPADIAEVDQLDAAGWLARAWERTMPPEAGEPADPAAAARRKPFGRQFPGLAPPADTRLSMAQLNQALGSLPAARIGLVPARRPADALPAAGWTAFDDDLDPARTVWIAAVLRSWEARFGARLLGIGPGAELRLLVERPPGSTEAAERVAAEHYAFCDECGGQGPHDVAAIAATLVNAPVWTFRRG